MFAMFMIVGGVFLIDEHASHADIVQAIQHMSLRW